MKGPPEGLLRSHTEDGWKVRPPDKDMPCNFSVSSGTAEQATEAAWGRRIFHLAPGLRKRREGMPAHTEEPLSWYGSVWHLEAVNQLACACHLYHQVLSRRKTPVISNTKVRLSRAACLVFLRREPPSATGAAFKCLLDRFTSQLKTRRIHNAHAALCLLHSDVSLDRTVAASTRSLCKSS